MTTELAATKDGRVTGLRVHVPPITAPSILRRSD
jgi:hypothetical protein